MFYFAEERPDPDNPQRTATFLWLALRKTDGHMPLEPGWLPSSSVQLAECGLVSLGSPVPPHADADFSSLGLDGRARRRRFALLGVMSLVIFILGALLALWISTTSGATP